MPLARAVCTRRGILEYSAWREGVRRLHVCRLPDDVAAQIAVGDAVVLRVEGRRRVIERRL